MEEWALWPVAHTKKEEEKGASRQFPPSILFSPLSAETIKAKRWSNAPDLWCKHMTQLKGMI
jgi:hypothetical protein